MTKRLGSLGLLLLSLLSATQVLAGTVETNLSGRFRKGDNAEIYVTGLGSGGFNFRLSAGNITPGEGCVNGPADCLSLWGWATRTAAPDEFLYANENGQCTFYLKNEENALVIHGLQGSCGTEAQNRAALQAIDGAYTPLP